MSNVDKLDFVRFGKVQIYFDSVYNDNQIIDGADIYFMDGQLVSECIHLMPHIGVYGCGRPWMALNCDGVVFSLFPDVMRSVMWYQISLPRPYMVKCDDKNRYVRLVGATSLSVSWRVDHYQWLFGVSSLQIGIQNEVN